MKLGRRQFMATTVILAASGCSGGASTSSAAPVPAPSPSPSPSPSPAPTPTPTPAGLYPSYNVSPIPADSTGMTGTAADVAAHIKLGWNTGNTLEAIGGEKAWGNPLITQALMDKVKALGFDAVRLPCSWDQYADKTTAKISDTWLKRVKDVVQYCMNANLYVLLNIHWDGGWLDAHINATDEASVIAKQKAFWEQIATTMRDFDQRLMFASANEPPADKPEQVPILLAYHQTFIDAVRSTGGKNAYRVLVVQAPSTSTEEAVSLWKTMPTDSAANRLMLEVHYYTPSQFTLITSDQSWGKMFYYWGKDYHSTIEPDRNATWGEEDYVDQQMLAMKQNYTSKGIPVILGEFGCMRRTTPKDLATHNAAVTHWTKYVAQQALANGVMPFLWDTGGVIDRNTLAVSDQATLDAMLEAAGKK